MAVDVDEYRRGYESGVEDSHIPFPSPDALETFLGLRSSDFERGYSAGLGGKSFDPGEEDDDDYDGESHDKRYKPEHYEAASIPTPTRYRPYSPRPTQRSFFFVLREFFGWLCALSVVGLVLGLAIYGCILFYNKVQEEAAKQHASSMTKNEVDTILNGWVGSIANKDIEKHMGYYAQNLTPYYGLKKASIIKVRSDVQYAFAKYTPLSIELTNITFFPDSSGVKVRIVCDKKFNFQGDKVFSGSVRQTLWIENINGSWRITGLKEGTTQK